MSCSNVKAQLDLFCNLSLKLTYIFACISLKLGLTMSLVKREELVVSYK